MSIGTIIPLAYALIGLGFFRYQARDSYYSDSPDKGKFGTAMAWGSICGVLWPVGLLILAFTGIADGVKWISRKQIGKKIGAGSVLLLLGRPPEEEKDELPQ